MRTAPELTVEQLHDRIGTALTTVDRASVVGELRRPLRKDRPRGPAGAAREAHAGTGRTVYLGKLLQFSSGGTVLREHDLVAAPSRIDAITRWTAKRWQLPFEELDGRQVTFEVDPELRRTGGLALRVDRVVAVEGTGCWTLAKAAERERCGAVRGTADQRERKIHLAEAPRRITVIAPPWGMASQSDIRRKLIELEERSGIPVVWSTSARFTGARAPGEIAGAVRSAGREGGLVLLARGGGGAADFWPFETAEVAEAIRNSPALTVTAIGHEEDRALADDVADHSFAVPRAAVDAITAACGALTGSTRSRSGRTRSGGRFESWETSNLRLRLRAAEEAKTAAELESAAQRRRADEADRERSSALRARDLARAELGRRIQQSVELDTARTAVLEVRDAVRLRVLSALPAVLALLFARAGVVGADGADRIVWAGCALLLAGTVGVCWAAARRVTRRALTAVSRTG
jgi:exodeoxyribonuclease VII large subunit